MNLYEVTLHGTDSIYLLASTKYRALELAGDYPAAPRQRLVPEFLILDARQSFTYSE